MLQKLKFCYHLKSKTQCCPGHPSNMAARSVMWEAAFVSQNLRMFLYIAYKVGEAMDEVGR